MAPFDKLRDSVAITVLRFTFLRKTDGLQRYHEPYIVSVAVDAHGLATPKLQFNVMQFPKVAKGGTVTMLGDGLLLYGPRQPGEFVALSILFMESDQQLRNLGATVRELFESRATELGVGLVLQANPAYGAVLGIVKELAVWTAGALEQKGDTQLCRVDGTYLRDSGVPYEINRQYTVGNDFIEADVRVIPLQVGNGQGVSVVEIEL